MSARDVTKFIGDLSAAGVRLWASEGRLQFRAPPGMMTSALRAAVSEKKRAILAVLGGPEFHAREVPAWTPILRYHQSFWKQLQGGEFDVGFINGTFFVVKCNRRLDAHLLGDRVAWLASRHSILRARVVESDDVGFVIDQPHASLLKIVDLSCHRGGSSRDVKAIADDLVWYPFDPLHGPLARIFAIRLNASEHLLGLVAHHFICDRLSLEVLSKELLSGPCAHETPALQYSDYIRGMNEWIVGWGLPLRMEYWRAQLRNAPATRLPPDFECDPDASAELNVDRFILSAEVASALNTFARRKQTTMFTVLLAAKMSALSWVLGRPDIVLLVQHHHRDNEILLGVVGAITDRLPLRAQISVQRSFEENLTEVHEALRAAYAYDVPLSVIEDVLPEIGASVAAPAINFVNVTAEAKSGAASPEIEPFRVTPAPKHGSARKHTAHWMNVACNGAGIHGSVGYCSALYRRETFARFLGVFCSVLAGIAENAERPVVELCNRKPS
jgi:hypothetical protein